MGCKLTPIVKTEEISFSRLKGKYVAIDGANFLIRYVAKLNSFDNKLKSQNKDPISHYIGLFYFIINLIEKNVKPIFVFDGIPLREKKKIPAERNMKVLEYWKKFQRDDYKREDKFKNYLLDFNFLYEKSVVESTEMIKYMGIPVVKAPSDAEAQASRIVRDGHAFGVLSHDYDTLLYGSKNMLKDVDFKNDKLTLISLERNLENLGINYNQLIDMALLIGTDFNKNGIKGIGPKKALKLIKKFHNLEIINEKFTELDFDFQKLRDVFQYPISIKFKPFFTRPNFDLLRKVILKHKLSFKRIEKGISRLRKGFDGLYLEQKTITKYF